MSRVSPISALGGSENSGKEELVSCLLEKVLRHHVMAEVCVDAPWHGWVRRIAKEGQLRKGHPTLQDQPHKAWLVELKKRRAGQLTDHLVVLFAVCAAPATVLHRRGHEFALGGVQENHTRPCRVLRTSAAC